MSSPFRVWTNSSVNLRYRDAIRSRLPHGITYKASRFIDCYGKRRFIYR